jgi:hypothetical protein
MTLSLVGSSSRAIAASPKSTILIAPLNVNMMFCGTMPDAQMPLIHLHGATIAHAH